MLTLLVGVWIPFVFPPAYANPKGIIAFLSSRNNPDKPGWRTAIYLINADGTNEQLWLENPEGFSDMAWSPDGKSVALAQYDADRHSHLFVKELDTGQQKNITALWAGWRLNFGGPSWSPDSKWLALTCSWRDKVQTDVCRMTPDGDQLQILTWDVQRNHNSASWSPRGDKIAFTSAAQIFVMDHNGRNWIRLSQQEDVTDRSPAWSPDGTKIAFYSNRDAQDPGRGTKMIST